MLSVSILLKAVMKKGMKLYLDVCCLNRPFDDQGQDRIRLESEAVMAILTHIERGDWTWTTSEMVDFEISRMPDADRRQRVSLMTADAGESVRIEEEQRRRANALAEMGFKPADALHVACAEKGTADVLLTTDDRFVRTAERHADSLFVQVRNALSWIEEMTLQ